MTLKYYSSILFFFIGFSTHAQRFDSALSKLNREYKQEKLYLHFDRALYNPGETIWFKAYLFTDNLPSLISKTIYAELVDDKGKILDRKIAPVVMSSAAASFDLPTNLPDAVVFVRAYTKWMLNFDTSFIYTKAIPLVSLKKNNKVLKPIGISLNLFPEGGDLVQNVQSRVAFKATDNVGMPVQVSGELRDGKGNIMLSFTSLHDGMGYFDLLPKIGEIYKAIWKDTNSEIHEILLPVAKENGVVLEVNNNALQIEYKIKRSESGAIIYPFVFVVAQMNNQMLYRAKVNLAKTPIASGIIPSDIFPAGIVQVTVFSPDEKPIAERITFINPSSSTFNTDVVAVLKSTGKRKKNEIQIDIPDSIAANLSVAITDADLNALIQADNIFSTVLLTSDIKGYVHQPAYYFSNSADSVADHLDLVMMTNGWRRFNWNNILAGKFPNLIYRPENYLSINGKINGLNKNMLANKEVNGVVELKDKKREFINTKVLVDGSFIFPDMMFYDTAKLYYQFNNDKKKALTLSATFDIKNNFLQKSLQVRPDNNLLLSLLKSDTAIILKNIEIYKEQLSADELQKVKTLKAVVITAKKKSIKEIMDEEYTSGLFSGGDSKTILPEDDPAFLSSENLLTYLQNRVAGLQVDPSSTENAIRWRGEITSLFVNEITQQSLNPLGKMVEDASYILGISMSDVAMVKIFDPPFFGAWGAGPGGAVAVYLKKGISKFGPRGLEYVNIPGYTAVKEFYSPDYSKADQSLTADYRKTLYWNPFIFTNKTNRRVTIPFYNNDITKKIKIIIEGCNEEGKLTRTEKVLQ